jgi:hypothetical protein
MTQDAAKHALGPWAERVVDSTPETRAELIRNVAAALDAAVAEAVKERDALADQTPLTDDQHVHTFGAVQCYWCVEREKERRTVAGARREERAKALKRINACIRQDTDGETMEALNVWIDELRKSLRRQRIRGDHEHECC